MANAIFNKGKIAIGSEIDWSDNATTTIKVALVTSAYGPDIDLHKFFSDITNEVVGTGYVAGGGALANRSVAQDDVNDRGVYDGDDLSWLTSTITARGAIIYKDTGVGTTSPLIAYIDFLADKVTSGAEFKIVWHVDGIFYLS